MHASVLARVVSCLIKSCFVKLLQFITNIDPSDSDYVTISELYFGRHCVVKCIGANATTFHILLLMTSAKETSAL